MAGVQGVLGDLQDAVVAEQWLRRSGRASVAEAFVAGELVGHATRSRWPTSRAAFPSAWADASASQAPCLAALIPQVRAAGGVVSRHGGKEILVIHRPKYDDWSLPKGKASDGESDEDCAVREVEEETGFLCALGARVADDPVRDRKGRFKEVRYWAMEPLSGEVQHGNDEVDVVSGSRSMTQARAAELHARSGGRRRLGGRARSVTVLLIRHAVAKDRSRLG